MIPLDQLQQLWDDNRVSQKRLAGILIEIIARAGPATNPRYQGGTSRYLKLLTPSGYHIGTVHEIVMPDGAVPHSHPHDYTLPSPDCSRVRCPDPNDPKTRE